MSGKPKSPSTVGRTREAKKDRVVLYLSRNGRNYHLYKTRRDISTNRNPGPTSNTTVFLAYSGPRGRTEEKPESGTLQKKATTEESIREEGMWADGKQNLPPNYPANRKD